MSKIALHRHITKKLHDWKLNNHKKPLIIRGARQVGKTTQIQALTKSYSHNIQLNLEKSKDKQYFEKFDDLELLLQALFLDFNIPISELSQTLLFIDEIQESPKAISLLRYFHEDYPNLDVIAAGSLLEFALAKVSNFPVGRVQFLYMAPLNFEEYLHAINHEQAINQLQHLPIKAIAHETLLKLFHQYCIIGGMPEIVYNYTIQNQGISDLQTTYESIWQTYQSDIEKYAKNNTNHQVIKHIIQTAHLYLDQRIKFQNFGNSNYRSREVGEAMRMLHKSKILQLIYPTTDNTPPLKPNLKKSPRLQFIDTGLINYALGIQSQLLTEQDFSKSYKGALIPHIITQELISINTLNQNLPMFWVRENKNSNAEIDLMLTHHDKTIPIEIKSGKTGTLKSLHQYIDQAKHPYAIRIYAGTYNIERHTTPNGTPYTLMNLPYYLGTQLPKYAAHLLEQ